jgi:hypothetical protein
MIIRINKKQRVISQFPGTLENCTDASLFEVPEVPENQPNKYLCYNPIENNFYFEDIIISDDEQTKANFEKIKAKTAAEKQKKAALQWLTDNDWKVNKRTVGEWTENDPRWLEYLDGRKTARAQYDEAVTILAQK